MRYNPRSPDNASWLTAGIVDYMFSLTLQQYEPEVQDRVTILPGTNKAFSSSFLCSESSIILAHQESRTSNDSMINCGLNNK